MADRSRLLAEQLRRTRLAAGLSLSELARRVHYSKGYLSKIETGHKPAGLDVIRRCDAALNADGKLVALAEGLDTPAAPAGDRGHVRDQDSSAIGEVWLMNLESNGSTWFNSARRPDALASDGTLLVSGLNERRASAAAADEGATIAAFKAIFEQHRLIGQTMSPSMVLPALIAQTHTLRALASAAHSPAREQFLRLASRYAEYVGWMSQEAGNDRAAMWWTNTAVDMANAAGDLDLAAHSRIRHALISLYQDDAIQTIQLAHQAQTDPTAPARIRGMAALREAQGHALAGDERQCRNTLDRAAHLLDPVSRDGADGMALGTTAVSAIGPMVAGWCLYDLGHPAKAADILDQEIVKLPVSGRRAQARFGARRALSHAAAGEIDHACTLTSEVLDNAELVDSATIRYDLRRLARTLGRWHSHGAVRELQPRLTMALHAPVS